jgi:hypothetical protein
VVHLGCRFERHVVEATTYIRTQGTDIYTTEFRLLLVVVCIVVVLMVATLESVMEKARWQSPQFSTGPRESAKETFRGSWSFVHGPVLLQRLQL